MPVLERPYPIIGYMGSPSHAEDLEIITPALDRLMSRNDSLVFETFGIQVPEILLTKYAMRCFSVEKVQNYKEFQSVLASRGWWIGLAPLVENQFNYCKANTKLLEYIQAGIPVVSSDYGPYKDAPSIQFKPEGSTTDEYFNQIQTALFSRKKRSNLYNAQLDYCRNFSDSRVLVDFYRKIVA